MTSTIDYRDQLAAMNGPQLVEAWNEMVATAHELGVPGADALREVTRFSTPMTGRTRCLELHEKIVTQRGAMAAEDAGTRASGTVKTLDEEYVAGYDRLRGPSVPAAEGAAGVLDLPADGSFDADDSGAQEHVVEPPPVADAPVTAAQANTQATVAAAKARQAAPKKAPKYTMASTVHPAADNPYEAGTERHEVFKTVRPGMTVREFCDAHGKYPRALNFLNPLMRDGAVTVRSLVHGVSAHT